MEGKTAEVFISYKAEDRARVHPLVAALEAEGFSVWWDTHIGGGVHWRDDIQEHLDGAKCVIVVWTKRSVGAEGDFVRDEAAYAKRRGIYLPVRFDAVELPLGFREVQAISLKGWHGDRSDPRFIDLDHAVRECITGERLDRHQAQHPTGISRRAAIVGGIGVGAIAIVGAGGWLLFRPAPANANRIAVMDFDNLSGDPSQAYFSEGIAEELRSSLSGIGMQVIGRTSSEAVKSLDTKVAASKLGVANIVTGSVRRSPETIRIEAQLVGGSDGVERWAQRYDRAPGDSIKIQTDIAESVARALSIALGNAGRAALSIGGTTNAAAQDLVLKVAQDDSDSEADVDRKLALLNAAIALDPNYAEAYARKANAIMFKAELAKTAEATQRNLHEALSTVNHAIILAPNLAYAYLARAYIYADRLQLGQTLADAERSMSLPGGNARTLSSYAAILSSFGRFQEAFQLSARAIALDPLNGTIYLNRSGVLFNARHFSEAADSARRSLQLSPNLRASRGELVIALMFEGKIAEAEAENRKLTEESGRSFNTAMIAARSGRQSQALDQLKALRARWGDNAHYGYAQLYAQVGMIADAFNELELAWKFRDTTLGWCLVDPFLDPLRRDPRLALIQRKLGFPGT